MFILNLIYQCYGQIFPSDRFIHFLWHSGFLFLDYCCLSLFQVWHGGFPLCPCGLDEVFFSSKTVVKGWWLKNYKVPLHMRNKHLSHDRNPWCYIYIYLLFIVLHTWMMMLVFRVGYISIIYKNSNEIITYIRSCLKYFEDKRRQLIDQLLTYTCIYLFKKRKEKKASFNFGCIISKKLK